MHKSYTLCNTKQKFLFYYFALNAYDAVTKNVLDLNMHLRVSLWANFLYKNKKLELLFNIENNNAKNV